jgi:hypothetical protein
MGASGAKAPVDDAAGRVLHITNDQTGGQRSRLSGHWVHLVIHGKNPAAHLQYSNSGALGDNNMATAANHNISLAVGGSQTVRSHQSMSLSVADHQS